MKHHRKNLKWIGTAAALILGVASPAMSGGTLKIEGLGPPAEAKREMGYTTGWDYDVIRSVQWMATQDPKSGKPFVGDFYVTKVVHRSTPLLYKALFTKERMTSATVILERATSSGPIKYLEFHMTDVMVTSMHTEGPTPEGEKGEDKFSLGFSTIKWEYTRHDPATSQPLETIKGGYDAVNGKYLPGTTGVNPAWFRVK